MGTGKTSKFPPAVTLLLVVVVFMLALSGCGLGGASTTSNNEPVTTEPDVVTAPENVDFGVVKIGTSKKVPVEIKNPGNTALTIQSVTVSGSSFKMTGLTLPTTLAAGSTLTTTAEFSPTAAGTSTGSATVTTSKSNGNGKKIGLQGTAGTSKLEASPNPVAFGSTAVGKTAAKSINVTNSGTTTLNITGASTGNPAFTLSGWTFPVAIAANSSKALTINFAPTATGSLSGNLSFISDATSGAATVSLSGTATAAGQLFAQPTSVSFGSVSVGTSTQQNVIITNTGGTAVTFTGISGATSPFTVSGLATGSIINPGSTATLNFAFAPTATGSFSANIGILNDGATSPATVPVSGTGVSTQLTVPGSLAFGSVNVGSSAAQNLAITNSGTAAVTISQITTTGAAFSYTGVTVPLTLTPGQSATASVRFAPTTAGTASGSITVTSDAPSVSATLSGTGVQPVLSVTPTSMAFGNVNTGSSATQALTLRNTGTATLNVSAVTASGTGFSVSGFTLPLTIAPGGTVAGSVRFAPTTGGSFTGSVAFTSNSGTAAAPVSLTGTGVAPAPQLAITPTSMSFGSVTTGSSGTQQLTLRNSGTADLHVTALTATGSGFSVSGFILPLTLTPGTTAVGNVRFAPTTAGAVTGSVTVASDSATAVPPVALSGTGVAATPQISVTPTSIAFGDVTTGSNSSAPLTLRNTGTADLSITAVTATGAGYSVNGFILPLTLAPNATAVGNVVFAPTVAGAVSGTVAVTSNSATPASPVSLTGTGVAPLTYLLGASPTSLSFGNVLVGASASLNVTLRNNGTGSVSVTAANVTGTGYSVSGTFPVTIAAGATRTVSVTFAPQLSGAANGSVAFVSNATNSPATVSATGNGQAPLPHFVDLSWTASTSTSVIGYKVYRATSTSGPFISLNASPVSATTYTDSTVTSGTTYYYVVRSVDTSNVESADSNQAPAVVPSP